MDDEAQTRVHVITEDKACIANEILADLPEWFGIPSATAAYVSEAERLPMLACLASDGAPIGFLSLKRTSPYAADVHVLGVKRAWHRKGVGRSLISAAKERAIEEGALFLTVKTLSPSKRNQDYATTRIFYDSVGFLPLEEFPTLWGENNPCLVMIQCLGRNFPAPVDDQN